MKSIKCIALALLSALVALAQPSEYRSFCTTRSSSLSGAAEVITVQQPASGSRYIRFTGASIYASVETAVALERDGTAASSTSLTVAKLNSLAPTNTATAWRSSNVGAGTTLAQYTIPAGQTLVLDLAGLWLIGDGTAKNLTLRTSSVTGTVKINVCWEEQ